MLVSLPMLAAFVAVMSAFGSAIGVYVGMKVGLARLETWKDFAAAEISQQRKDVNVLQDDVLTLDYEMSAVTRKLGLDRAVRGRVRA